MVDLVDRARHLRLLLTDCDGVLTDGGVYYSARGEELKRFSIRDGMGVERLRTLADVEVGIVTGEALSPPLQRRVEKLGITELHLGARDKGVVLDGILQRRNLAAEQVAYIGDDTNDLPLIRRAGLRACPCDAMPMVREVVDYVCRCGGGHGAFREFAELIIATKMQSYQLCDLGDVGQSGTPLYVAPEDVGATPAMSMKRRENAERS